MFEEDYGYQIDIKFWIKFGFCFVLLVMLPVWIFNFATSLGFLWKVGFTVAGAAGILLALSGKKLHK